jgi:hypothetical protein
LGTRDAVESYDTCSGPRSGLAGAIHEERDSRRMNALDDPCRDDASSLVLKQ